MKSSRGVVKYTYRLALLGALSVGCSAQAPERASTERQRLLDGCTQDSHCEDGNPCTQNLCAVGLCAPALPVLGCCYEGDCTDPAADGAIAPIIELRPSGCSEHGDCEDGHPCTQNLCVAGECAALPVLSCCLGRDCLGEGGTSGGGSGSGATGGGGGSGGSTATGGTSDMGGTTGATSSGGKMSAGAAAPVAGSRNENEAGSPTTSGSANDAGATGSVGVTTEADYRMQGGGCDVGPHRNASSTALVAALLGLGAWLRGRRKTASLRHS